MTPSFIALVDSFQPHLYSQFWIAKTSYPLGISIPNSLAYSACSR
jgi:hypothetical protein